MRLLKQTKGVLFAGVKLLAIVGVILVGLAFVWVATFDIPDIQSFSSRQVERSTKIYDHTGEILLYDLNRDVRRTTVPLSEISENLQAATLAIEDSGFYSHKGIKPSAILRAAWTNLKAQRFEQGGSTITQQVVKNTLLTPEKTISRKVKEWVLALRLDQKLTKEQIMEIYLNEVPYGGRVYGAEEAAKRYFGKSASDLTVAESAYLAALPKAPTYYSPYGNNLDKLKQRKNEVLREMKANGFISQSTFENAKNADVTFSDEQEQLLKAPHFVFYIKQYLEQEYGTTAIERRGLKVVTTLDHELQQKAKSILSEYGKRNAERYNANNAALVATEPDTGKIRVMVGSREYGNNNIQGSFNAATAKRQPGSAFKPFAYAAALNKGYTDQTVVFDLPTQFSNTCPVSQFSSDNNCFSPVNYDGTFRGPITFRNALAQSVNVPSVKVLYLAGMEESLDTARQMGITTLENQPDRYGLSLVLGSGEVTLLDITNAYGVFANEGVKNKHTPIKQIKDANGNTLEEFSPDPQRVLPEDTARQMNDMLSDNQARTPAFGPNSPLHFDEYDVAAKTGTTNNYRDLWTVGYTPDLAVGVWSGNNDNTSIDGEVAGFVVAPMWHAFVGEALSEIENNQQFTDPTPISDDIKPVLRGIWQPGNYQNSILPTGMQVRRNGPQNSVVTGVHNILHWVDKNNPRGPVPTFPDQDSQYDQWEYSVRRWITNSEFGGIEDSIRDPDDASTIDTTPSGSQWLQLKEPLDDSYEDNAEINVHIETSDDLDRIEILVNNRLIADDHSQPFQTEIEIEDINTINKTNPNELLIKGFNNSNEEQRISHTFNIITD